MIRLAIVEDEESSTEQLRDYLEQYSRENGALFKITVFSDGDQIASLYRMATKGGIFDLILMDIQMPGMDGMTAAAKIRAKDPDVLIMFITNRLDYAVRGYEVDALDYIVKPVEYFSFAAKLRRGLARIPDRNRPFYVIESKGEMIRLRTDQIYYVESEGHTLVFHTMSGEYRTRERMNKAEEDLAQYDFCRCNKGYLVNLRPVDGIRDGWCLVGDAKLIISRGRRTSFMEKLTTYLARQ